MIRKAKAVWRGTGRDGTGDLSTESQVLSHTAYSYKSRFESGKGTNPEELLAAAHAGCFTMAVAFALQLAGFKPTELATEAAVTLEPDGAQAFKVSRAQIPEISQEQFSSIARGAEQNCPISKVLKAEITLDARLG
jgi:osmotically inducible protein OsmC